MLAMNAPFVEILKRTSLAQGFINQQKTFVPTGGTRTPNLRFRRPTPYPLGHAGTVVQRRCHILRGLTQIPERDKKVVRRPGIEPGSQEWESCMIPLHQRRSDIPEQDLRNQQLFQEFSSSVNKKCWCLQNLPSIDTQPG